MRVDLNGAVTGVMGTSSSGQGHETLVSTVIGEVLERDPAGIRVVRADSLQALPSNSPVGSRMAIMLGGAAAGAARKIRETLIEIAAHNLGCTLEAIEYSRGQRLGARPSRQAPDVGRADRDRAPQDPPDAAGHRARPAGEIRVGGADRRRAARRRRTVQIYPCYSFEAHVVYVEIDPDTAAAGAAQVRVRPRLRRHDQRPTSCTA